MTETLEKIEEVEVTEIEQKTKALTRGLNDETVLNLQKSFIPFFKEAEPLILKAKKIKVTSVDQEKEMKEAREIRLTLVKIRTTAEKVKIKLKENIILEGNAISGMWNIIKYLTKNAENYLQEQEDFIKIQEEKRLDKLEEKRITELSKYEEDHTLSIQYNLREMTEEAYQNLLDLSRKNWEARKETERKAEEERIVREKAEAEERERIKQENEQLKKEAEERECKAEIERKKQEKIEAQRQAKERKEREIYEAKIEVERKEKERIEAELKAKQEAEEKAKREAEEKERQARLAPDKKKLEKLAVDIVSMPLPELKSEEAKNILSGAVDLLNKVSAYIKDKSCNL